MNEGIAVTGHCYCGAIQFRVCLSAGERPIFTAYCHCDSCRRAHSAPLYHVVVVDEQQFEILAGEERLVEFKKPGQSPTRAFCGTCGSKILNRFDPQWRPGGKTPLAFFPPTLDEAIQQNPPEFFAPQRHNQPEETVLHQEMLKEFLHDM